MFDLWGKPSCRVVVDLVVREKVEGGYLHAFSQNGRLYEEGGCAGSWLDKEEWQKRNRDKTVKALNRENADRRFQSGKPILVPLTTSLYVPGKLADTEHVIVDVGTGFYVEKVHIQFLHNLMLESRSANTPKTTKDATKFYEAKVEELGANLKDLESIVQGKSNNLRVVEDGMSQSYSKSYSQDKTSILIF